MATRKQLANAIRVLAMDSVQKAKSGHPGAPMGMADIAEVLWRDFLKHNPTNPKWADRDRFVLSNGHGSMLIYSLLHLTGYDLSIEDLKQFRQLHSKTLATQNMVMRPVLKPRLALLVKVLPMLLVWQLQKKHLQVNLTVKAMKLSITTLMCS